MRKGIFAFAALSVAMSLMIQAPMAAWAQDNSATDSANVSNLKQGLKTGVTYYVNADKLNLRSKNSTSADSVVGTLSRNDQVQIVDLLDKSTQMVKIKIIKSSSASQSDAAELFVSAQYLSAKASSVASSDNGSGLSKYILIQNVATEKMRIYERCSPTPCSNHLIMETDMVVGRPEGSGANQQAFYTWLGRFKITQWVKFYQDGAESYPSWYDPNYPTLPAPGASMSSWISSRLLPSGKGGPRGAFGWYTALTGPNSNNEWVHGTLGWGADGDKFIKETRKFWLNVFTDPRSHGCTRVENRAIAYTRHMLPEGTEIFRVYAQEALRDPSLAAYANQRMGKVWNFTLTKEGVRSNGPDADAAATAARGIPESLVLERGSYTVNETPSIVPYKKGAGWISRVKGKSGNTYDIDDNDFHGVFLVDEGRFIGYRHPESLPVGGYDNHDLPDYMKTSGNYSLE